MFKSWIKFLFSSEKNNTEKEENKMSTVTNKVEKPTRSNVVYARSYRKFIETDSEGNVTEGTFEFDKEISAQVIRQDKYTIVILNDGSKGIAKCMEGDTFSYKEGLKIAFNRAMIAHLEKETKKLCHAPKNS